MLRTIISLMFISAFICHMAEAGVVLKIRAVNPLDTEEVASVRYDLPKETTPGDILGHRIQYNSREAEQTEQGVKEGEDTSLEIRFNESEGVYYVHHDILLAPKEVVTLELTVKDVWIISEREIEELKEEVFEILDEQKMADAEEAVDEATLSLKGRVLQDLDFILEKQEYNSVTMAGVDAHMEAYQENIKLLEQVEVDIAMLEYLVMDFDEGLEEQVLNEL